MKDEAKKISRIINELSTHYLSKNPSKLDITVDNLFDRFKITFEVCDVEYSEKEIEKMLEILNEPRLPATETYYWTLRGDANQESELSLIGMMIDKAEITFKNSNLYVHLHRFK